MKIKIKILSPVHIGSGNEISPLEYFIKDGKFYRVDVDSLFSSPEFKPMMDKFIEKAKLKREISEILPVNLLEKHVLYSIDVSPLNKQPNPIQVKEYIKSAGRVYIPGSSLKGSILSGVIENVLSKKKIEKLENFEDLLGKTLSEIRKENKFDSGKFIRWIDVRDSDLKKPEESLKLSLIKIVGARREGLLPVLYETLKEDVEFETEIISHSKHSEEEILKFADQFYRKVYRKEREFARGKNIILPEIPSNSYLLRIGQGSTAWSTSFLILADELGIKNYDIRRPKIQKISGHPRTRKLLSGTISMGWISITKIEKGEKNG
jgi:CRISPR type III-A-associated RAMP protein Csm5